MKSPLPIRADPRLRGATVFIVFGYRDPDWPEVEGVFTSRKDAEAVADTKGRSVSVCPVEVDKTLDDRDDWPNSYYAYPSK